ncbi:hypothetical protein LMC05_10200 [Limosilactobacillus reuteri]|uniref:hypothetical protein n=1 Tax=Limosilactobacillus reuteri TaxID=1598 RepID=UPI001E49845C|nr:hypothetical protein [Limosilactobacillus reuteri]MCC4509320.1 hypothetical protein [Limosilactobacillus reuteri]MCC4509363.1 hypothetical protein [Limosilactobacillus reuteri]
MQNIRTVKNIRVEQFKASKEQLHKYYGMERLLNGQYSLDTANNGVQRVNLGDWIVTNNDGESWVIPQKDFNDYFGVVGKEE